MWWRSLESNDGFNETLVASPGLLCYDVTSVSLLRRRPYGALDVSIPTTRLPIQHQGHGLAADEKRRRAGVTEWRVDLAARPRTGTLSPGIVGIRRGRGGK